MDVGDAVTTLARQRRGRLNHFSMVQSRALQRGFAQYDRHQVMQRRRIGFVMEQALGHVTHYMNFRKFTEEQPDVAPVWMPIPFVVDGAARVVPVFRTNWSVRASWRARRALSRARAESELDAVVFHTQVTSLFSIRLMQRVPSLISLDATPINYDSVGAHYGHRPASDGFMDQRKFQLNRRAFGAAAGLVTWSEWARQSLLHDYGVDIARTRVLAPGSSPVYFEIGQRRAAASSSTPPRKTRLLFVGADFNRKGGPLLLECMRSTLGESCDLHVVTQSDIPAQRNVRVHRNIKANSPELQQLFHDADIFVLPTRADCLSVVLMEAAAAGLPLITTNVGALREALVPGTSGFLVHVDDSRELVTAITALVVDEQRRSAMGRASYALARHKFDARVNNRQLLDFVGELVDSRSAITKDAA